jgi:hypothetical protein
LLALFEVEPIVADRGVPWLYNHMVFETTRIADRIRCEIEPGYEQIKIVWWHEERENMTLDLHWVRGLRVITGGGIDYMIASFRNPYLGDLEFHLKPEIKLHVATSAEYPR